MRHYTRHASQACMPASWLETLQQHLAEPAALASSNRAGARQWQALRPGSGFAKAGRHRRVHGQHAHVSRVQDGSQGCLQQSTIAARMLPRDNITCPARIGLPMMCCTNTKAASHVQVLNHTKARKRQPEASTNLCSRGVGGNMHAETICRMRAFQ